MAWAQNRGISRVEVQIDSGDWQEARLALPISQHTWVQWVHEWDATPGPHIARGARDRRHRRYATGGPQAAGAERRRGLASNPLPGRGTL